MTRTIPQLCGSISSRVSPSGLGVKMHEAGYQAAGVDFKYVSAETHDLRATVGAFVELGFRGFAVSMPFKREVLSLLAEVSPDTHAIGACNTVVNNGGWLTGYNTDWRGAMDALRESGVHEPGRALVIGAGGAARALIFGLKESGWHVELAARNLAAATAVATDFDLPRPWSHDAEVIPDIDLLVNATPNIDISEGFLAPERFPDLKAVFDVVFNPLATPLCNQAARLGLISVPGWLMLLHQAMHQFALYTGLEAPAAAMRDALLKNLR